MPTLTGTSNNDNLSGSSSSDILYGNAGNDNLSGNGGNDTIYGGIGPTDPNDGNDTISGGDGDDLIYGNSGNDNVSGDNGNDTEFGGRGNDTLSGGSGNDIIYGNEDSDNINGGDGNDTIFGGATQTDPSDAADTIWGSEGNDLIYANGGNDVAYGNNGSDVIYGGDGNDTIYGGSSANDPNDQGDTIDGNSGNDVIYGNSGNDIITNTSGADIIYGGQGNDTITGSNDGEAIYGNGGNDNIQGSGGNDTIYGGDTTTDPYDSSDTINSGDGNDIIYANGGNDIITNTSGSDIFYGGDGNDTITGSNDSEWFEGGSGADHMTGNGGTDTASYATAPGSVTVNLTSGGTAGDASGDTYSGIENVLGSGYNDPITGDSGNNILDGNNGNDTLDGGQGADTLQGGTGDDLTSYGSVPYNIQANLNTGTASDGDVYYSIEGLQGSNYNDTLTGNSGNNTLLGGSGNDTVYGAGGSDTVSGDAGDDLLYGGSSANDLTDVADSMSGGSGNDLIYGNGGNDLIHGDSGMDTLYGGQGNDTVVGGSSDYDPTDQADVIDGNEGDDVVFGNGGDDIIRNLSGGKDTIYGGEGNDSIAGGADSEVIYGNAGSDNIQGGASNDTLYGGSADTDPTDAADTIESGEGDDVVYGNGGADMLSNIGGGKDTIYGGTGNDSITGGPDAELLYGNEGSDTLTGGGGDDTFVITKNSGDADVITDFNLAATFEKIDVRQFDTVNVFSDLTISQNADGSATVSLGNDQTIQLTNTNASALSSKDFLGSWSSSKSINIYNIGQLYDQVKGADGAIPDYVMDKISHYTITDFDNSNPGNTDLYKAFNLIDISRFNVGSLSITTQNGSAVVDLGAGRSLTIEGVTADKLSASNFILNNSDTALAQVQQTLLQDWRATDEVKMGTSVGGQAITHTDGDVSYATNPTSFHFVNSTLGTPNTSLQMFTIEQAADKAQVLAGFNPKSPYDIIDLSKLGISSFDALGFKQVGSDAVVNVGSGQSLILPGVDVSALKATNFSGFAGEPSTIKLYHLSANSTVTENQQVLADFDPTDSNQYIDISRYYGSDNLIGGTGSDTIVGGISGNSTPHMGVVLAFTGKDTVLDLGDGKLITIPNATLDQVGGKVITGYDSDKSDNVHTVANTWNGVKADLNYGKDLFLGLGAISPATGFAISGAIAGTDYGIKRLDSSTSTADDTASESFWGKILEATAATGAAIVVNTVGTGQLSQLTVKLLEGPAHLKVAAVLYITGRAIVTQLSFDAGTETKQLIHDLLTPVSNSEIDYSKEFVRPPEYSEDDFKFLKETFKNEKMDGTIQVGYKGNLYQLEYKEGSDGNPKIFLYNDSSEHMGVPDELGGMETVSPVGSLFLPVLSTEGLPVGSYFQDTSGELWLKTGVGTFKVTDNDTDYTPPTGAYILDNTDGDLTSYLKDTMQEGAYRMVGDTLYQKVDGDLQPIAIPKYIPQGETSINFVAPTVTSLSSLIEGTVAGIINDISSGFHGEGSGTLASLLADVVLGDRPDEAVIKLAESIGTTLVGKLTLAVAGVDTHTASIVASDPSLAAAFHAGVQSFALSLAIDLAGKAITGQLDVDHVGDEVAYFMVNYGVGAGVGAGLAAGAATLFPTAAAEASILAAEASSTVAYSTAYAAAIEAGATTTAATATASAAATTAYATGTATTASFGSILSLAAGGPATALGGLLAVAGPALVIVATALIVHQFQDQIDDAIETVKDFLHDPAGTVFGHSWTSFTGTDQSEIMRSDSDKQVVALQGGNDAYFGYNAWNVAFGGSGNDVMFGGNGSRPNELYGNDGDDYLKGGNGGGNNILVGNAGSDYIVGGSQADAIYGQNRPNDPYAQSSTNADGNDTLIGGHGVDIVSGGDGNDLIYGGTGESDPTDSGDLIYGGAGADTIYGNGGNDTIYAGGDNDKVYGGEGDDHIYVNEGNNSLTGGTGSDHFYVDAKAGTTDVITDLEVHNTGEKIVLTSIGAVQNFSDLSISQQGANTVIVLPTGQQLVLDNVTAEGITGSNFLTVSSHALSGGSSVGGTDHGPLVSDTKWVRGEQPTELTYSFDSSTVQYHVDTELDDVSNQQKDAVIAALNAWSRVAGVVFTEQNDNTAVPDISIASGTPIEESEETEGLALNFVTLDTHEIQHSDVFLTPAPENTTAEDNYTALHEAGHALGLGHNETDNPDASVMNEQVPGELPTGLLYNDIAAIQELYGANHDTNSGDDTYKVGSAYEKQALWDGAGNDTIDTTSVTTDVTVDLNEGLEHVTRAGNATLWMAAGSNIENAITGSGNDSLQGNSLNNSLAGGDGDDTFYSSAGEDTLDGGTGNDTLIFTESGNLTSALAHVSGIETLNLASDDNTLDITDTLVSSTTNNTLTVNGSTATILNASGLVSVGNKIFFAGGVGNDSVTGGAGNDTIVAAEGNDTLSGGSGDDSLDGGAGDDVFISSMLELSSNDTIIGGDGNDTLVLTDEGTLTAEAFDHVSGIEKIVLAVGDTMLSIKDSLFSMAGSLLTIEGSGNDTIDAGQLVMVGNKIYFAGSSGNDLVTGGAGNDSIIAEDGNDTLVGGSGDDSLDGGAGNDSFSTSIANLDSYDTVTGGTGTDTLTFTDAGTINASAFDHVSRIETISLASGNNILTVTDALVGSAANSTLSITGGTTSTVDASQVMSGHAVNITGSSANDSFTGGSGNDTLLSGDGNDTISSGSGDDSVDAGVGNDSFSTSITDLDSHDTVVGGTGSDTLTFTDAGTINASSFDHVSGIETITLASGTNTLTVTDALAGSATGTTLNISGGTASSIDASQLGAGHSVNITGGSGGDNLTGGAGNDTLSAGDGNDTLTGGSGDDSSDGGAGNDSFSTSIADLDSHDTVTGGTGNDTLTFTDAGTIDASSFDHVSGIETISLASGTNTITITDALVASSANSTLSISGGTANTIDASQLASGHAVNITGSSGNDNLTGGAGNDTILADGGNDTLTGSSGDDSLDGGAGDDVFYTSTQNLNSHDTIIGGDGNDTLVFTDNGTITADMFAHISGIEHIILASGANTLTIPDALVGSATDTTLIISGGSGNDVIIGGNSNDTLLSGDGNDTLSSGSGDDSVDAGAGNDSLSTSIANLESHDTVTGGTGSDTLTFTDAGTINASSFGHVSGIENITLASGTNTLTVTDALAGSATGGTLNISGGTVNSIDASQLTTSHTVNITGGSGGDSLTGGAGNDTFSAGNGNDTVTGGSGSDSLDGGSGNDSFHYTASEWGGDSAVVGGAGSDAVQFTDTDTTITDSQFAHVSGVENIEFYGTANTHSITLGSNADANSHDLTLSYQHEQSGDVTLDASALHSNLNFTSGSGNDVITMGSGNDNVSGGAGNDSFTTSIANLDSHDTLDGGVGSDSLNFTDAGTVNASAFDHVSGIENIHLATGNNTLTVTDNLVGGSSLSISGGTANSINAEGLAANHTVSISGGTGNDSLIGGAGNDTLKGGNGNDTITGGEGNDSLRGGAGADSLNGGAGNDAINGDSGNDTLVGGAGNDTVVGGQGINLLQGSEGNDTLVYSADSRFAAGFVAWNVGSPDHVINGETISVQPNLQSYDVFDGGTGQDKILLTDDSDALFLDDAFTPQATPGARIVGVETIQAGGGNDVVDLTSRLYSYSNVSISGGAGNDVLWASSGSDVLDGGTGNDNLNGGTGDDTLIGGAGNDSLTGSWGKDIFVIGVHAGDRDIIRDFTLADDKIDISTFNTLTQFSMLNIAYSSNKAVVNLSTDQSVTLQQIASGSLNAGHFILATVGSSANDSAAFATETVAPLMPVGITAPVEEAVGA